MFLQCIKCPDDGPDGYLDGRHSSLKYSPIFFITKGVKPNKLPILALH
jgi:hypothetical protein